MTQKPETIIDKIEKDEETVAASSDGQVADASREASAAEAEAGASVKEENQEPKQEEPPKAAEAVAQDPTPRAESGGARMAASDTEQLLAEKESELAAMENRLLRQAADFQNFRKRALEERSLSIDIGRTQVAMPMIEVLDDLRRSLEAADEAGRSEANAYRALREGVKLVFEKFETELARVGIEPMEVVGEKFDEEKHEAMLQQPAPPGTSAGTILAEIQKGYMIGDRVLRHARVVVAT